MSTSLTAGETLARVQEILSRSGIPEPEADAQVLLAHVLGMDRLHMLLSRGRILSVAEQDRVDAYVRERRKRKPLQYILGEQEFWSLAFRVTPDVLIPRPETETLVETVLATARDGDGLRKNLTVLDLCTGSGILAVVLAKELPDARVYGVDVSPAALHIARENAERHRVSDAITFLQGDLFSPLPDEKVRFDIIVSNPPYVCTDEIAGLSPEVRDYEPGIALDGGRGGVDVICRIVRQSAAHLREGGWLFCEMGDGQSTRVREEIDETGVFDNTCVIRDYCGIDRVVKGQKVRRHG